MEPNEREQETTAPQPMPKPLKVDPYLPLPGENIQAYLQRVPGPVKIVRVFDLKK